MERQNSYNDSNFLKSNLEALIRLNETHPEKAQEICMQALKNIGIKNLIRVPSFGFFIQEDNLNKENKMGM